MPFALKPGDAVTYEGADYLVTAQRGCRDASFAWQEWRLADAATGAHVWAVAIGEGGEWLGVLRDCMVDAGSVGAQTIRVDGVSFALAKSGRANVALVDQSGRAQYDRMDYWHYAAEDGVRLIVLKARTGTEAKRGGPVAPDDLRIYPV